MCRELHALEGLSWRPCCITCCPLTSTPCIGAGSDSYVLPCHRHVMRSRFSDSFVHSGADQIACATQDAVFAAAYSGDRFPLSPTDFLYAWWSFADSLAGGWCTYAAALLGLPQLAWVLLLCVALWSTHCGQRTYSSFVCAQATSSRTCTSSNFRPYPHSPQTELYPCRSRSSFTAQQPRGTARPLGQPRPKERIS